MKKLLIIFAVLFISLSAASCSRVDDEIGYTLLTPVVDLGETLDGGDFIMTSAFTDKKYTATVDGSADTKTAGRHTVSVTVRGEDGYERTHTCSYTVRSYVRDSVRLEAGTPITMDKFINKSMEGYARNTFSFVDDELTVASYTIGTHRVGIYVNDVIEYSSLIIEDTTPPSASPVTVHIDSANNKPRADDFVADIKDATSVKCEFKEDYDFNTNDDVSVVIVLTDESGNVTEIESRATCEVDTTPPIINGVHDITVVVGGTVSYKDGITVTDDSGEKINLSVDNSRVNLSVVGTYEVTYSATDSSGNNTVVHASVIVTEKSKVSEDEMMTLAKRIYKDYIETEEGMIPWDIARRIYDWTHDNIKYVNEKVDKNDPIGAAYDGMKDQKGDCFTYMAVSRVLLGLANIDCREIERDKREGEAAHYWLLVDIGDGWYHFDSCLHFSGMAWDSFMRTDAELKAYCEEHDIEYYYRFDVSKYPARATQSYYE